MGCMDWDGHPASLSPGLDLRRCALLWTPPFGMPGGNTTSLSLDALQEKISDISWPLFESLGELARAGLFLPKYVVATSASFLDSWHGDFGCEAAAFAAMETLCKYTAARLASEGVRMNVIRRPWPEAAGSEASDREVAGVALSLCSGLMDGVCCQILTVDRGAEFLLPVI